MLKARHIIATSIVLGLAAVLVIGGVGRTQAKTSIVNESYHKAQETAMEIMAVDMTTLIMTNKPPMAFPWY